MNYDVIVVGARCAGATLGTLLARSGVKTLMLDAHAMPSDMPMSTHFVHTPGMDVLDEIGVGDAVRARTPPTRRFRARMDGLDAWIDYPKDRLAYCPRRSMVDPLIQEAAVKAGAELRDRTRVVELVKDGDRVAGVVVESERGRETLRANLVVGADGRHSTIAKLTGVEEYLNFTATRAGYWFYAKAPSLWHDDPRYAGWDGLLEWQGDGLRYLFQTDDDNLILVATAPSAEVRRWKGDYLGSTIEYLKGSEIIAPVVERVTPIGKGVGLLKAEWFFRRPVGPGFALVGDAGCFKDFITGLGMTDAFIGARNLHRAILKGTEAAFEHYWRERDAQGMALYFDAEYKGDVGYNNRFMQALFERMKTMPEWQSRLYEIADRKLSPLEAFSMGELLGTVGRSLLRGHFGVLPDFLKTGKRMNGYKAEVARRQAMLDALTENGVRLQIPAGRPEPALPSSENAV